MKSNGKASTCYSDNPKMGKPYQSQGKGYRDGGRVPDDNDSMLRRLQVSGGAQEVNDRGAKGIAGGGRLGVNIPMDNDRDLTVGVSGSGYKIRSGGNTYKGADVTGADLSYRKGDTTIGVEVSKQPTKLGDKRIMFRYKKEF
jgi:hypothetical protein